MKMKLPSNVFLVGFMGSGKTTTGKELAKMLGFRFLDTDQLIEQTSGKEIKAVFEEKGENYFRSEESRIIKSLNTKKNYVISTGGGAWLFEENRVELLKSGWCVWLKVSPEKALKRLGAHIHLRPLLASSADPLKTIKALLSERDKIYSIAHTSIDTNDKNPKEVAFEIIKKLKEEKPIDLPPMQE